MIAPVTALAADGPAPGGTAGHVAFFAPSFVGGGVELQTVRLAAALAARGWRTTLLFGRVDEALAGHLPPAARRLAATSMAEGRLRALAADPGAAALLARPVLLSRRGPWQVRYLRALTAALRETQADVLVSATTYGNLAALWARRAAGLTLPVVVSERLNLSEQIRAQGRKARWRGVPPLVARAYDGADAIVAVSEGVADDLAGCTGLPRGRIRTIYNPVVGPDVATRAAEPPGHPWFGDGGPPVVLGVGRLAEQKDFPTLIRAFARVRARRPARLVILGKGGARDALTALARELGVAGDVALPGFVANPFACMARAGVFALSSRAEGLPAVLIQALACGCPAVSTDCPSGPAEILEGGRFGRLVPVGDDEAMAAAMIALLDEAPDRERLHRRAAGFSVDAATEAWLDLLDRARHTGGGAVEPSAGRRRS